MGLFDRIKSAFGKKQNDSAVTENAASHANASALARMMAHENRKILAVLKAQDIDEAEDERLVEMVFDHLNLKINNDYQNELKIVGALTPAQQAIYHIWWMEAEVNNGGFIQYFDNSSGQFAAFLPDSLRLINATQYADLALRANLRFQEFQKNLAEGKASEDDWFESMNDLDTEFYASYDSESLSELQAKFIRNHKADFLDG